MVDEQRTQIGTLKALGYGKGSIMAKYLLYSGSAALLGCLIGVLLGGYIFPLVIWKAYHIMYRFSDRIVYIFDPLLAAAVVASFLLCTLAATWYSCSRELNEVPAALIRPRAPKSGKRTVLERIPLLWNRLGFFGKVSARNIVRYRQRLFMMVIGIGGCMALLITGFGLQDSIRDIVNYQFEEITLYDSTVTFSEELTEEDRADFLEACGEAVGEAAFLHISSADVSANGLMKSASLLVTDGADLGPFIDLHRGEETLAMPGTGEVVINDGLASALHISVGDSITLRNGDMEPLEARVCGIFDNYVFHYCILNQETCLEQWGRKAPVKSAYVNFPDGADAHAAAAAIMDYEKVGGVSVTADLRGRVSSMLNSIRYITLLVVLCAGSLAFIVQYNLTNININERVREIATIKVIGFYPREAAAYVFRETRSLTAFGALAGIPMGILLHRFVVSRITIDLMRFDVRINALSYLYCLGLTFLFSCVVDFFMFWRIRDINMAESLKSVE
jgi:putative ABC transport system permease protein